MKRKITIPIYDLTVWLVVSDNIVHERKKMEHWFGASYVEGCVAFCSYGNTSNFGLFFKPSAVSVPIVAHEIFHLTHRIIDFVEANFDRTHHEPAAYLNEYLFSTIFPFLFKPIRNCVLKKSRG